MKLTEKVNVILGESVSGLFKSVSMDKFFKTYKGGDVPPEVKSHLVDLSRSDRSEDHNALLKTLGRFTKEQYEQLIKLNSKGESNRVFRALLVKKRSSADKNRD